MKSFLLFLYGIFEDHDDVDFFCTEILGTTPAVSKVRYVIENSKSIIVIFETDMGRKELSEELHLVLTNDIVKFYFLFERESIYSANLPLQLKDFIFKPNDEHTSMRIEYEANSEKNVISTGATLDVDVILEKIEKSGVESLTDEEKNFLDNFEI